MKRVVCFGAGGHAKVVLDALALSSASEQVKVIGLVAQPTDAPIDLAHPVLGEDKALASIVREHRVTHFVIAIGSVRGGGRLRPELFELALDAGLEPLTVIHPNAVIAASASIGGGSVVMAGAVLQPGVRVGRNVIINTRASIDHDCRIGDHAHIAPGSVCSGNVCVGEGAHVGTAAAVIEGITIGRSATVGAGAVVVRDCPDHAIVYGVPAREKNIPER
jgi:sugar O-acyltransferase (sialic acid O-acetyltransferase NeuD family)